MTAVTDARPEGQPGHVTIGRRDPSIPSGLAYPAVRDDRTGTVRYWRDTETAAAAWLVAPPKVAESFEPGPEWQASCRHVHGVPWRCCDSETQCTQLALEDARYGR